MEHLEEMGSLNFKPNTPKPVLHFSYNIADVLNNAPIEEETRKIDEVFENLSFYLSVSVDVSVFLDPATFMSNGCCKN